MDFLLEVNSATCDYCSYHVKRAYKSMSSKRSAIQSSFSGNEGVRSRIMDKVDPRGENREIRVDARGAFPEIKCLYWPPGDPGP